MLTNADKQTTDGAFSPNDSDPYRPVANESLYPWKDNPTAPELLDPLIAKTLTL